jgi:hypothetical protein
MRELIAATVLCLLTVTAADARPRAHAPVETAVITCDLRGCRPEKHWYGNVATMSRTLSSRRPRAWCGWFLAHHYGLDDRRLWLARNWAAVGRPAHGPASGVIAVWRHHVGVVTAVPGPRTIILLSGNDGHAVREREWSTAGIIAYRWPS